MHKSENEVAQSCLTLSDPMDCSPPGSSVHGIFQTRVLEWGAIAFSGGAPWDLCIFPVRSQSILFCSVQYLLKNIYCYYFMHFAVLGLSCGMRDLQSCGMQTLNCGRWDLIPWPGIKWGPLHWEHRVLVPGSPGKSQCPVSYVFLPNMWAPWGQVYLPYGLLE